MSLLEEKCAKDVQEHGGIIPVPGVELSIKEIVLGQGCVGMVEPCY